MRWTLALLAVVLAAALWFLLLGPDPRGDAPATPDPAEVERERPENLYLTRGHEVLTLWARTPDRSVPPGTEVGYRHRGHTRWVYAEASGRRIFTDAPIGTYDAVARAPGYPEARQTVRVEAGVPSEVVLMLRPGPAEPASEPR